jgi:hypothetical protein
LIKEHGTQWKTIAIQINNQNEERKEEGSRTALNCKDKWVQMGAKNHEMRNRGPWKF